VTRAGADKEGAVGASDARRPQKVTFIMHDQSRLGVARTQHVAWNAANKRLRELRTLRRLWTAAGRSTVEISEVIAAGGALDLDGWALGAMIGFTFADYKTHGRADGRHPSEIRPIDATQEEIKSYLTDLHRPRKAAARRKRRAEEAASRAEAVDLDCRGSAIVTVLGRDKSRTVRELMTALARCRAFTTPDGKRLSGNSLRVGILRELKRPTLRALIEITTTLEKHGKAMLLIRRRRA
jgi:hypothetical protein